MDYIRKEPLRLKFLGLVFLAICPWILPWISTLFKSLKGRRHGGVLEKIRAEPLQAAPRCRTRCPPMQSVTPLWRPKTMTMRQLLRKTNQLWIREGLI